jgi:hypothetical protein
MSSIKSELIESKLAIKPESKLFNKNIVKNATENTLITQYFMKSHDSFDVARRELYAMGVGSSYSNDLVIYYNTAKNINAYTQECNGLILDKKTYKPYVVPPRTLRFNISTEDANKFLHQGLYYIYQVEDGTVFNLYFKNSWIISTTKGMNMNDVKWDGNETYQQLITEILESIGLNWNTFTGQLNKLHCYSFGFKHPKFHKFLPSMKILFIKSVNLEEGDNYLWATDKSPIPLIQAQKRIETPVNNIKDLYKKSVTALNDFLDKKEVNYGYILRSVNYEATGYHSDLLVESSLMKFIRNTWYDPSIINECQARGVSKELTITLAVFLNDEKRSTFLKLYPQYAETFGIYGELIANVVHNISCDSKDEVLNKTTKDLIESFKELDMKADKDPVAFKEFVKHPASIDSLLPYYQKNISVFKF